MFSQPGTLDYYFALQKQARIALRKNNATIVPIQFPEQGDFHWNYLDINRVFNSATFDYISARVRPSSDFPGAASLTGSGGFPKAYLQVVSGISYALSSADGAAVNKARLDAAPQGEAIVDDFEATFGAITPADIQTAVAAIGAVVNDKLDYVVGYVVAYVWSGAQPAKRAPLSYAVMAGARNLPALLPGMPISATRIVMDTAVYLNILGAANTILARQQLGAWILAQLVSNTSYPTLANGGMSTVDPVTGAVSPDANQVAYTIGTSVQDIQNDLDNTSAAISLSMTTSGSTDKGLRVSIEGQAGISVGSFLQFSGDAAGSHDMNTTPGTSQTASVEITYAGWSMVPIAPLAWQQATNVGWYDDGPISEAINSADRDVTGYKFVASTGSQYDMMSFANGGNFGFLDYLLISNVPTVKITYTNADYATFVEHWNTGASGNLSLFGVIPLGGSSTGACGSTVMAGADNSTFTVTFAVTSPPSTRAVSVPPLQRTAFVIGGGIRNA